jgi:hypothetical protein
MKELFDFILVRLYYRLFVRPHPAAKAASKWEIDLSGMKVAYQRPQAKGQSPFAAAPIHSLPLSKQPLTILPTHRHKQFPAA